jgi:TonB family protein
MAIIERPAGPIVVGTALALLALGAPVSVQAPLPPGAAPAALPIQVRWQRNAPASTFEPARLVRAAVPERPTQAVGWGEVLLEVDVDAGGAPVRVTTLRSSPPFTEAVRAAVTRWRFDPARWEQSAVRSAVLVAGLFRAAALSDTPALGSPPRTVGEPSPTIPFPLTLPPPVYPSRALGDAMVLIEVMVTADGGVRTAEVVHSSPGFDEASLEAARRWTFRPANHRQAAVAARAYLLFGFREPIVTDPPGVARYGRRRVGSVTMLAGRTTRRVVRRDSSMGSPL